MAESQSLNLIEYKAGRMIMLGKMIEPDGRKGLFYMRRTAGDNQVHIHWMDRRSGAVELDIVATPGALEFRRIEQCVTGRVYVLKYTRSAQRYFFWMQEPQADRDADFCQRVNELIATGERKWDEIAAVEGDVDTDMEHRNSRRGGGGEIEELRVLEQMRQFLAANLPEKQETCSQTNQSLANSQTGSGEVLAFQNPDMWTPNMEAIFRPHAIEAVNNLLVSPKRRQRLLAQLPKDPEDEGRKGEEGETKKILDHLHSPEFNEALSVFSQGLQSGVPRSVLKPLLKDKKALNAARAGDIERFLRVLHRNPRDYSGPTD
ncbi:proteasomal ubiquitin receptor ADRM1 homolog [Drosophila rhopaloa]|uniref:Proteasomal ubiquitin receptor ADRM1 homolog n=1 Tax=Drosophila rhopaloa TaxID=1041015 RepID=A0A6P4F7R0_DRORH|nr:proteasomal ubiquitin receptor ADRM1 homolog [Drosophila rhopaloa]